MPQPVSPIRLLTLLRRENGRKDGSNSVSGRPSINGRLEPTISELGNRRNEEQAPALAPLAQTVRSCLVPGEGFEPSRGLPRRILSAVRLPFRHPGRWNSAKFTPLSRSQDRQKSPESLGSHAILPPRFVHCFGMGALDVVGPDRHRKTVNRGVGGLD